jgi:hypothetical protein
MENDIAQLKRQVAELMAWKDQRTAQQIMHPLDINSINILNESFMRIKTPIETTGGAAGNTFITYIGNQGNLQFTVERNTYVPYTVNTTTDFLTATQYFPNDTFVYFATSDTLPSPLVEGTQYFVVNSTGTSFQVSATQGGAAINLTTTGTGSQFIYYFQ